MMLMIIMVMCLHRSATSKVRSDTCGLHGVVQVLSQPDIERRVCWGNMTDWSDAMCGSAARLRLTLTGRCFYTENAITVALIQQGIRQPPPTPHYSRYFFH